MTWLLNLKQLLREFSSFFKEGALSSSRNSAWWFSILFWYFLLLFSFPKLFMSSFLWFLEGKMAVHSSFFFIHSVLFANRFYFGCKKWWTLSQIVVNWISYFLNYVVVNLLWNRFLSCGIYCTMILFPKWKQWKYIAKIQSIKSSTLGLQENYTTEKHGHS